MVRTGDARIPLLLAGASAVITCLIVGSLSPFDAFRIARLHGHLRDHAATLIYHFDSDRGRHDSSRTSQFEPGSNFDEVVIENTASATITIGDRPSVAVNEPSHPSGRISTVVRGGKLVISSLGPPAHLSLTVTHLRSLRVNGPGDINLVGLHDPLSIVTNGPSSLRATGAIDCLNLMLNGPSNLSLSKLQAKNVAIRMNGGGNAEIFATDSLMAEVHGDGRVRYLGEPHTTTNIDGSGSIAPLTVSRES